MNYGPLLFLGVFLSFALSWCGMILMPQLQIGRQQLVQPAGGGQLYPVAHGGLAEQGRLVYRREGCAECHSQQVRQTGVEFNVRLTEIGTNEAAVVDILKQAIPDMIKDSTLTLQPPTTILKGVPFKEAESLTASLNKTNAKAETVIVPLGPDIARGWGSRGSVAQDYIRDNPVLFGSQRVGPDLATIGERMPDAQWHLIHLYNPKLKVEGSSMPPYRYLFITRPIRGSKSANALDLPKGVVSEGYEVVPTKDAAALVAYLQSLKGQAPLFEAPMAQAAPQPQQTNAAPESAGTNAPGGQTNAPEK